MNLVTQGEQIIWPQGLQTARGNCQFKSRLSESDQHIRIAFSPLLKFFLQLGHTRETEPSAPFSSVKWTSTSDFNE